jgi:hypothetical protein
MPKGEKIRPKQIGSATTCEIFEKSRVELLICQNNSYYQNLVSCEKMFDYGKRGSFWLLIIFILGLSLFVSKHMCLT